MNSSNREGRLSGDDIQLESAWKSVRKAAALCRRADTRFILLLSPWLRPHYYPEDTSASEAREAPEMLIKPEDFLRFQEAFDQVRLLAKQDQLEILDLGVLYAEYSGKLKVTPIDHEHLNALGHRLVAAALAEKLENNPRNSVTP